MPPNGGSSAERIAAMVAELEQRVESARRHEKLMAQAHVESADWSDPADREWAVRASIEAIASRVDAERTLAEGRDIVARAAEGLPPRKTVGLANGG